MCSPMPPILKLTIILVHFSVYFVVAINVWVFSRRSHFFQTVVKLRSLPLIYCGFGCYAIATSYEISEHMGDNWFYASQISDLNRLFYTFISAGTCLIALGLKKSRILDMLLIASLFAVPLTYGVQNSKGLMQVPQLISTAIFIYNWYVVMRDWRVFLYLLLSKVGLGFGIALIVTGQQILHIFVGPSFAVGLLILGYVAWVQPQRHGVRSKIVGNAQRRSRF